MQTFPFIFLWIYNLKHKWNNGESSTHKTVRERRDTIFLKLSKAKNCAALNDRISFCARDNSINSLIVYKTWASQPTITLGHIRRSRLTGGCLSRTEDTRILVRFRLIEAQWTSLTAPGPTWKYHSSVASCTVSYQLKVIKFELKRKKYRWEITIHNIKSFWIFAFGLFQTIWNRGIKHAYAESRGQVFGSLPLKG